MLLTLPSAVVVDVLYQLTWLPYSHFGGTMWQKNLFKAVGNSLFILCISDLLAASFVCGFIGITGAPFPKTLEAQLGGHEWLAWLLIGAPSAWIGGQVIPASAVTKVFGEPTTDVTTNMVRTVLDQPGTMRKAALLAVDRHMKTFRVARRTSTWDYYSKRALVSAADNPYQTVLSLREGLQILGAGGLQVEELKRRLDQTESRLHDSYVDTDTGVQAIRELLRAFRQVDFLDPVKSAVWSLEARHE
jgi:hypothetical protein